MTYVVARPKGLWDVREARMTPRGPRSYTLASFRTLTPAVLSRARQRASKPLDAVRLREAAVRAGAPVEPSTADRAAAELLIELSEGRQPRPALETLLLDTLQGGDRASSDNARAAAAWVGATPERRGRTLVDLLMLADALPHRKRERKREPFPRIQSRALEGDRAGTPTGHERSRARPTETSDRIALPRKEKENRPTTQQPKVLL
jgi:hypothetical protein